MQGQFVFMESVKQKGHSNTVFVGDKQILSEKVWLVVVDFISFWLLKRCSLDELIWRKEKSIKCHLELKKKCSS